MFLLATKEQKQKKVLAEKLLRVSNIDYDTWLEEQHQKIIEENQELIFSALDSFLYQDKKGSSDSTTNNKSYSESQNSI